MKFYDKNYFTALYRNGEWFYQKFHTKDMVKSIAKLISSKAQIFYNGDAFEIMAINDNIISEEDAINALKFEFNLPLPNGKRYGLAKTIEISYRNAISNY